MTNTKTCKDCLHCSVDDGDAFCTGMPWHYPFGGGRDKVALDKEECEHFLERRTPAIFNLIAESLETLAEKLVFVELIAEEDDGYVYRWRSTIFPNAFWYSETKAITATLERLKEVKK